MSSLPEFFPTDQLPAVEQHKVEAYYEQFVVKRYREYGMGHFWLACYAALPAVITPDLLYKIWMNFSKYSDGEEQQIHHIAVADLLLSTLFNEISTEIYEMQVEVKNAFLKYWQAELADDNYYELPVIDEVAKFLLGYTKVYRTNDPKGDHAFREAQAITAWSYLDTKKAEELLLQSLATANQQSKDQPNDQFAKAEQMRLLEFNRQIVERQDLEIMAEGQSKQQGMNALVGFSQNMKTLLEGNEEAVLKFIEQSDNQFELSDTPNGNLSIKAPEAVVKKLDRNSTPKEEGKLYMILVGIDVYENEEITGIGCEADVKHLMGVLQRLGHDAKHTKVFINEKATKENILDDFREVLYEWATPSDQILFFFAGHQTSPEDGTRMVVFDSQLENERSMLALDEILELFNQTKSPPPFATFLLDTVVQDVELPNEKIAIVSGQNLGTEKGSVFFNPFFRILERSRGRLSLQKLMAATLNETGPREEGNQKFYPALFAHPETARHSLVRTNTDIRDIQYLLRASSYDFNGSANGIYDTKTDKTLRSFLNEKQITQPNSPRDVIQALEDDQKEAEQYQVHYFLYVFSNPDGRLPMVDREYEMIQESARQIEELANAEIILLKDPSRGDLYEYFRAPAFRNSLRLFHFSGFEADPSTDRQNIGLFLQNEEGEKALINYSELHKWMDFQGNLQLVFLNTCHSANLAKILTTRGVRAAIAADGPIIDDFAFEFAKRFYNHMMSGQSLIGAFDRSDISPEEFRNNVTRAVGPREGEDEPVGLKLFFNWAKQGEARKWEWGSSQNKHVQRYIWCIDNGHGKLTKGKRSPIWIEGKEEKQLIEYQFNRDIAERIMRQLSQKNIAYFDVVPEVEEVDNLLKERVERANDLNADLPKLFLSIHCNAGPALPGKEWTNPQNKGIEVWHAANSHEGEIMASTFLKYMVEKTGLNNRGVKFREKQGFFVLRKTNMPAILTENGFYNNEEEVRQLMTDELRQKIAEAHVAAILEIEKNGLGEDDYQQAQQSYQ